MIELEHRFTSDPLRSRYPFGRKTQLRRRYDWDAQMYFNRVQAEGVELTVDERSRISACIRGLKSLGAYNNLLEGWFLRSTQNVGTGSKVLGFKSASGNLVNGPTWGATGLSFTGTQQIDCFNMPALPGSPCSALVIGTANWNTAGGGNRAYFGYSATSAGRAFSIGGALGSGDRNWMTLCNNVGSVNYLGVESAVPNSAFGVMQFAQLTGTTATARINSTDYITYNFQSWDAGVSTGTFRVVGKIGGAGILVASTVLFFTGDTSPLFVALQNLVRNTVGSDLSLP